MSGSDQLALFLSKEGRVHRDPIDTEVTAAVSMRRHTEGLRGRVLALLRAHPGGLTDDEGALLLDLEDRLVFGRRRQELCMAGLVHGTNRRRPSAHGRPAVVWVASDDVA